MVAQLLLLHMLFLHFYLEFLLYVLKKLLNQAAKVTTDIVKKHLAPFLADIGAVLPKI